MSLEGFCDEAQQPAEQRWCPQCHCEDVTQCHRAADFLLPECWYWRCADCGYAWGHA